MADEIPSHCQWSCVLFDWDGVIFDSSRLLVHTYGATLTAKSVPFTKLPPINQLTNGSPRRVLSNIGIPSSRLQEAVAFYNKHYAELASQDDFCKAYPGIIDVLEKLVNHKIVIGIISAQKRERVLIPLTQLRLDKYFDGNKIVASAKKPDPASIFHLARNFFRQHVVFVGDSPIDVQTAKNAGVKSVAVGWGMGSVKELKEAHPDFFANNIRDLNLILFES